MIKNYSLTAIRTIRSARVFSAINILGLAIAFGARPPVPMAVHLYQNRTVFVSKADPDLDYCQIMHCLS
jgi:hypothetical protein